MTLPEFESKVSEWNNQVETLLIDMARVTDADGLVMLAPIHPILDAYMQSIEILRKHYAA